MGPLGFGGDSGMADDPMNVNDPMPVYNSHTTQSGAFIIVLIFDPYFVL